MKKTLFDVMRPVHWWLEIHCLVLCGADVLVWWWGDGEVAA
jgi:hypothetical protein